MSKDTNTQKHISKLPELSLVRDGELQCLAEEFERLITEFYKSKQTPKEPP